MMIKKKSNLEKDLAIISNILGFAVGYGSLWRFPYLVYKNGGDMINELADSN